MLTKLKPETSSVPGELRHCKPKSSHAERETAFARSRSWPETGDEHEEWERLSAAE